MSADAAAAAEPEELSTLKSELRKMERQLVGLHAEQFAPNNAPRCDTSQSWSFGEVMAGERERRAEERRAAKERQGKYRDELVRKYKPLMEEELRKIDLQFPTTGSSASKKQLTKLRTQIFARRVDLEIQRWSLEEGRAAAPTPAAAPASPAVPSLLAASIHREATEHFASAWTPRLN